MTSYGQYCPVAKGSEILGDRWTILIVRELLFGPKRFSEFERGLPGISKSVLSGRLRRLENDQILQRNANGSYSFTPSGEELRPVLNAIGEWTAKWRMTDPKQAELDSSILMLFISRNIERGLLPDKKTIFAYEFADDPQRYWMTFERDDVSVCLADPGLPVALTVRSTIRELYRVYMGRTSVRRAISEGLIVLDGLPADRRLFIQWNKWSHYAPFVQGGRADA